MKYGVWNINGITYEHDKEYKNSSRVCFQISGLSGNNEDENKIWIEVDSCSEYVVRDRGDVALLLLIPHAVANGVNIHCKVPISDYLVTNIQHFLLPIISIGLKKDPITITYENIIPSSIEKKESFVATGISFGIDSFGTIDEFIKETNRQYRLTHLISSNIFGVGSNRWKWALRKISAELNLPVINIQTNVMATFRQTGLGYITAFNPYYFVALILILRPCISRYYIASSYVYNDFKIEHFDGINSIYNQFMAPTDVSIFVSGDHETRTKRTLRALNNEYVRKHINVCLFSDTDFRKKRNCSLCDKCLRVLSTMDATDRLDELRDSFDVDDYLKNHDARLRYVFSVRNEFNEDIKKLFKTYKPDVYEKYERECVDKYSSVVGYHTKLSDEGDGDSSLLLHLMYRYHIGVPWNSKLEQSYLMKSITQGSERAIVQFISNCIRDKKYDLITPEYFNVLHNEVNDNAAVAEICAECYLNGYGVRADISNAMKMYHLAINLGERYGSWNNYCDVVIRHKLTSEYPYLMEILRNHVDMDPYQTAIRLARLYKSGIGVEKDIKESMKYYRVALQDTNNVGLRTEFVDLLLSTNDENLGMEAYRICLSFPHSCLLYVRLGRIYRDGLVFKKNLGAAAYWYRLAMDEIHWASRELSDVLWNIGTKESLEEMFLLLKNNSDNGDCESMFRLAKAYRYGRGVEKSEACAIRWYGEALKSGISWVCIDLFDLLCSNAEEIENDENWDLCISNLKKLANMGNAQANSRLSIAHEKGLVVDKKSVS